MMILLWACAVANLVTIIANTRARKRLVRATAEAEQARIDVERRFETIHRQYIDAVGLLVLIAKYDDPPLAHVHIRQEARRIIGEECYNSAILDVQTMIVPRSERMH